jgi:ABC-type transport system involved in Fe-S cluster assembly fused permease/ATPase subunit
VNEPNQPKGKCNGLVCNTDYHFQISLALKNKMKITLSYFRKVYQDFIDEKITMSKMVELLNQRAESTFTIDQDEFNQKAQHILDTVVIPQVDKYEQRKLLEQMMAQDQEAGLYDIELYNTGSI